MSKQEKIIIRVSNEQHDHIHLKAEEFCKGSSSEYIRQLIDKDMRSETSIQEEILYHKYKIDSLKKRIEEIQTKENKIKITEKEKEKEKKREDIIRFEHKKIWRKVIDNHMELMQKGEHNPKEIMKEFKEEIKNINEDIRDEIMEKLAISLKRFPVKE